jgi:hypothetical protein
LATPLRRIGAVGRTAAAIAVEVRINSTVAISVALNVEKFRHTGLLTGAPSIAKAKMPARKKNEFTRTKIDTSGKLVDGTAVNGPSDLRNALLAHPEQFVQTFTEKMTMYALGRGIQYFDMPSIRKIVKDAKRDSNYKFSSIVMGIVNAPAFQSSVVERPEPAQVAAK